MKRRLILAALILVLNLYVLLSHFEIPPKSGANPRFFDVQGCCQVELPTYGKVFVVRKNLLVVTTRGLSLSAFTNLERPVVSVMVPW